jgi:hypothetical protein
MQVSFDLDSLSQTVVFPTRAEQSAALAYLMTCHAHTLAVAGLSLSMDPCAFHCLWDAEVLNEQDEVWPFRAVTHVTYEPLDSHS